MPRPPCNPTRCSTIPRLRRGARDISAGLRCLVCRNENIDESNAELARDLRLLVRERLVAGDTDEEVVDYIVDRYGEYVLLKPTLTGANKLLWIAGPVMLLIALGIGHRLCQPPPERARSRGSHRGRTRTVEGASRRISQPLRHPTATGALGTQYRDLARPTPPAYSFRIGPQFTESLPPQWGMLNLLVTSTRFSARPRAWDKGSSPQVSIDAINGVSR